MGRKRPGKGTPFDEQLVFEVCRRFFQQKAGASKIASELSVQLKTKITREQVYPILFEAHDRGLFEFYAPVERRLTDTVVDKFRVRRPSVCSDLAVQVVNARREVAKDEVPKRAARTAVTLIREIGKRKKNGAVHLGIASGDTSKRVARQLAALIHSDPQDIPPLVLHALSSGFSEVDPETACVTFFSFFDRIPKVEFIGLFTTPFVESARRDEIPHLPGARVAFAQKHEIDIVITSLAQPDDEHGELRKFIRSMPDADEPHGATPESRLRGKDSARTRDFEKILKKTRWAGDVQYRPYSGTGPIDSSDLDFVAVTLFELSELVERSKDPDKALLLVAGPCGTCGEPRGRALYPLLEEPSLKVWTHLVADAETAELTCEMARS
jgi:hypothetical protein